MMRISRVVLAALCLILAAGVLAAEEIERDFHRTFDVEPGYRLHLDHGDGDVVIQPWDQDQLDVKVQYRVNYTRVGVGSKVEFDVEFRESGSTVHVIGREGSIWSIGFFSRDEVEHLYTVRAPAYLILDIEGEDGDVEISGWRGEIDLRTEDGDLDLAGIAAPRTDISAEDGDIIIEGLEGRLVAVTEDGNLDVSDARISDSRVRVEDGDVTFSRSEGSVRFDLVDGDLLLDRFRPGDLAIRSDDGEVDLELLAGDRMDVEIRTGDGDVTVELGEGASLEFVVETRDGGIRIDVPGAEDVEKERGSASGRVGGGDGRLRVSTGDGRIRIRGR